MRNILTFLVTFVFFASPCLAQSPVGWNLAWDPDFATVSKEAMTQEMQRSSTNAAGLVKMIQKAMAFKYGDVAFSTLDALRKQHPDSPDTLAAFCWAYELQLDNAYMKGGDYRPRSSTQERTFKGVLAHAKQLAPNHWLVNFVSGHHAYAWGAEDFNVALPLLERAIRFVPEDRYIRAYCWTTYGGALNLAAMRKYVYKKQTVTFGQSVQALEKAVKIDPRQTGAWLTLFSTYQSDLKDRQNALRAKRGFLRAYPKPRLAKLPKWIKQNFAHYPD